MHGCPFCFFHRRYYDGTAIRPDRVVPARDFPLIRDQRDILTAITSLTRYIHEGRVTAKEAHAVMKGLDLADSVCKQIRRNNKKKNRAKS